MKKFLSNPTVALVLTVLLCICSLLLNTRVKLGRKCAPVNEFFYSGSADEASIASSLTSLCNAAEQLAVLGARYGYDDTEEVSEPVQEIRERLRLKSLDLDDLFEEYDELRQETFRLESFLVRLTLDEADTETYASAQRAAADAKSAIDGSSYNSLADQVRHQCRRFPAIVLAPLSGVQVPELFA